MLPSLLLCSLLSPLALAEDAAPNPWTLTPVVQVRPRIELDTGRDGTSETQGWMVTQRSRVGVFAEAPRWAARVVAQDVRAWGTETDTLKDLVADAFDMHEAWVKWTPNEQTSLTVGRQEIALNEQRLVGAVDWTQQGRAFDAARLSVRQGALSADLIGALITDGGAKDTDAYTLIVRGGWRQGKKQNGGVVDLLSVTELNQVTEMSRETVGLFAAGGTGTLSGRAEAYAQLGSLGGSSTSAYMIGLSGTLSLGGAMTPKLTLWFDNLSGDADLTDSTIAAFQSPFGTNHKFYGAMDVMCYSTACWVDGRGLRDGALKVELNPTGKLKANLDLHVFLEAADQDDGRDGSMIGQELDLWLGAPVAKRGVTLNGGLSALNRSADELVAVQSADVAPDLWAWMALDLSL